MATISIPSLPAVAQNAGAVTLFGWQFWLAMIVLVAAMVYAPRYGFALAGLIILYLGLTYFDPSLRRRNAGIP